MTQEKKHAQLGMNASTASGRLVRDILYKLVVQTGQNACFQCRKPMTRDTFSVEHKVAWIDSDDPLANYFDLDNISFSHLRCNIAAAKHVGIKKGCGSLAAYSRGCRCEPCSATAATSYKRRYTPEARRERYARTGK